MQSEDYALICDWFFSDKSIDKYGKNDQRVLRLAQYILTTHGVGGKFAESLIQHQFSITPPKDIHGWDGFVGKKPVEIKTETINKTADLSAMGSFADNRATVQVRTGELFIKERPLYVNVGLTSEGKCIYVMFTETSKLPADAELFVRLNDPAPRIRWGHYRDHRQKASKLMFFSETQANNYKDNIAKKFLSDLKEMAK